MRYHDMVIRALRQAGFSVEMAVHALTVLDSFIFGFALQEQNLPFESTDQVDELAIEILSKFPADDYPYLAEYVAEHVGKPGYDFASEFDFGLDLILAGLDSLRAPADRPPSRVLEDVREGFICVLRHRILRALILTFATSTAELAAVTIRLFTAARWNCGYVSALTYHRSESPSGGNDRIAVGLKEFWRLVLR